MEAKELRIGNYISIDPNNEVQEVVDVMCDSVNTHNIEGAHYGLIHPIPLTEEWLLKFGFVNKYNTKYYHVLFTRIYCDISNSLIKHLGNINGILKEVEYVHQLQNLFFYIIGEELTLNQNENTTYIPKP